MTATATATGELVERQGTSVPAQISSASAEMTFPGFRRETNQIISRSGATATGTFAGTIGDVEWSGILTLREGTYTLDPATGKGEHSFRVQLVRAVSATPAGGVGGVQQSEAGE